MPLMRAWEGRSTTPDTRPPSRARWGSLATAIVTSLALVIAGPVVSPAAADDVEVVAPTDAVLAGDVVVDGTLTVESSPWQPESVQPAYAWYHSATAYQAPVGGVDQNPDALLIEGAEAGSLSLPLDYLGRYVWVVVTGTADGLESKSIVVTAAGRVAEAEFAGLPTVSIPGTPRVGAAVTPAFDGAVPEGALVAHQWKLDGVAIDEATTAAYTPVAADVGHALSVTVTFTKPGYNNADVTSAEVTIGSGTLVAATPTLSGAVRVDSVVTANPGAWLPGTTFTYQWRVTDAKNVTTQIAGATAATFVPTAAMRGKRLSVVVTASQLGYATVSKATALATIGYGVFAAAPAPKITGNAHVGATLKVSLGAWKPSPSISYQWKVNGKKINGATKSSYKLKSGDVGKKVTVTIVAKRTAYTSVTRTSAATAKVTKPFKTVKTPTISGTTRAGSTLKASVKSWNPTATFSYQWKRNGVAIKGATKSSYKLTTSDSGTVITVSVTGKKSGYFARTTTSKGTAKVSAPNSLARDGLFRVGVDIAPGTYASRGGDDCYFERRVNTAVGTGDGILGWTYHWDWGMGGQKVITISAGDVYFYTELCGTWSPVATAVKTSLKDGTWVVGKDLKAGIWRPNGPFAADGCYIEVLRSFTGNPDVDIWWDYSGTIPHTGYDIRIPATAKGFTTDGCGTWKRVSN